MWATYLNDHRLLASVFCYRRARNLDFQSKCYQLGHRVQAKRVHLFQNILEGGGGENVDIYVGYSHQFQCNCFCFVCIEFELLFFIFNVLRQSAENMPSVQSFVATSSLPNICAAVIAFGFIRISLL